MPEETSKLTDWERQAINTVAALEIENSDRKTRLTDLETRLTIAETALERARLFVESLESVPILDQEDRDGLKFHARNAKAEIDRALAEIRGIDRALDREEGKDAKLGK